MDYYSFMGVAQDQKYPVITTVDEEIQNTYLHFLETAKHKDPIYYTEIKSTFEKHKWSNPLPSATIARDLSKAKQKLFQMDKRADSIEKLLINSLHCLDKAEVRIGSTLAQLNTTLSKLATVAYDFETATMAAFSKSRELTSFLPSARSADPHRRRRLRWIKNRLEAKICTAVSLTHPRHPPVDQVRLDQRRLERLASRVCADGHMPADDLDCLEAYLLWDTIDTYAPIICAGVGEGQAPGQAVRLGSHPYPLSDGGSEPEASG
eukprot:gnl/Dysnectes_brevis/951_a1060_2659.p1 GENE.gnl/Dysnectes_brevis/951_a1060_2659~~gnl/Dysnectes_brevis/951_a1060_2659.p1  ORF type:complete len:264 (-),score=20.09 gnl/Dysnectes_brevis/951_a1060_2659:1446-2237(-)